MGEDTPGMLPQPPTYHCQLLPIALFPPTTLSLADVPQHISDGPVIDAGFLLVSLTFKVMVAQDVLPQKPSALT